MVDKIGIIVDKSNAYIEPSEDDITPFSKGSLLNFNNFQNDKGIKMEVKCNMIKKCRFGNRCSHGKIHKFVKGKCDCPDCSAVTRKTVCIDKENI